MRKRPTSRGRSRGAVYTERIHGQLGQNAERIDHRAFAKGFVPERLVERLLLLDEPAARGLEFVVHAHARLALAHRRRKSFQIDSRLRGW